MRFCFVMLPFEYYSSVSGGAIATVTMNVVRELEKMGHEAFIVAHDDAQPAYSVGRLKFLPMPAEGLVGRTLSHLQARMMGWDWPHQGRFWRSVQEVLRMVRPDAVVLSNDLVGASLVREVLPGARIVVWVHNECQSNGDIRAGLNSADVFLSCSRYVHDWLLRTYGLARERVRVAYAGVDGTLFHPEAERGSKRLRLLYTGRLDPNKGVDIVVEAFKELKHRNLDVTLTVAGHSWFYRNERQKEDPFLKNLRHRMAELQVDWLGHVPRRWLPQVMREHDVALVVSRSQEPFGLVVLEAMASGLAVIASPHGGLSEACGEAGILVNSDSPAEVTDKLEELCNDREELQKWRQRSITRAGRACWKETASVLLDSVGAGMSQLDRSPIVASS